MDNEHNLVWVNQAEDEAAKPTFTEVVFSGVFNDALEHIRGIATNAKFLMGQVLSKDGKVLATIAPQGSIHISSD